MAKTTKRKRTGRPRKYGERTAKRICERLASGESLLAICADRGMPDESTVRGWVLDDAAFGAMFDRATKVKAHRWGDELITLADETPPAVDGRVDTGWVSAQKLRVNTRQWTISRMLPKVFGDRLALSGQEQAAPIKLSNEEAAREVALLLATAAGRKVQAQRKAEAEAVENDGNGQTRS